ncbi:MAG: YkgJ family cysteine cluster protein [Acidobacteriota bacterium]
MDELVQITRVPKDDFYSAIGEMGRRLSDDLAKPQIPLGRLALEIKDNLITSSDEPIPECVPCGVCCNYFLMVPVTTGDARLTNAYVELTVDGEGGPIVVDRILPRDKETGSCAHLGGTIKREVGCNIYEGRPKTCRDFEAGSDRCHGVRRAYGLESPLKDETVERAFEAIGKRVVAKAVRDAVIYLVSSTTTFDGASGPVVTDVLQIDVLLDEETRLTIHQFEAGKEFWFENEFEGLTLEEVKAVIAERAVKH